MAILSVQMNIGSEMQNLAEEILTIKNRLAIIVQMYASENMATIPESELQSLPEFSHITIAELTAAKNALDAINVAMGEYIAGTNSTKLMRIVRTVPK